jgi:glycosyltransferase involved in cell wall biosynthesis
MRICMIAYTFCECDTRIQQYANALVERGDTVDVIALRRSEDASEYENLSGINVHRIQSRTVDEKGSLTYAFRIVTFLLRCMWILRRMHQKTPYDLIHVHNVPDFLVFAAVSVKWDGVPVILDIHDLLPELYASKFKATHKSIIFRSLSAMEKCSVTFASRVVIANDLWRDRLVARSCPQEKCTVVRNYPDANIFIAPAKVRPSERQGEKLRFTYPGSLNWHQGLDIAIRAFSRVADRMPEAEFDIYGEGPEKPALIRLAAQLKMQDRIHFHDFVPSSEIARVMAETDIAIEPKRATSAFGNEALSTKILEFMALGVPVIASKTRIHAYYYDEKILKYYENDNEEHLAEALLMLRNEPQLRLEIANRALEYARQNTWQLRKQEYLQLVDVLMCSNIRRAEYKRLLST